MRTPLPLIAGLITSHGTRGCALEALQGGKSTCGFTLSLLSSAANSGSPVVNKASEFVGIVFDGNIQSLVLDCMFSDTSARRQRRFHRDHGSVGDREGADDDRAGGLDAADRGSGGESDLTAKMEEQKIEDGKTARRSPQPGGCAACLNNPSR